MKKQMLILGAMLLLAAGPVLADHENTESPYQAGEFSLDLFGTGSVGQETLNNASGKRIKEDVRLGAGAGVNYFFTRHFGISGEGYTEDVRHSFVDDASLNFTARLPIGNSCFAPYGLVGAGRQFDPIRLWHWQLGAGFEVRFNPHVGMFLDGRYVLAEEGVNYGLARLGVRIKF